MDRNRLLFWLLILSFFILWYFRVLYLPIVAGTGVFLVFVELARCLSILLYFFLWVRFAFHTSVVDSFALTKPTRLGMLLAGIYALSLVFYESISRILTSTPDPWLLLSIPITAITEEVIFRGFIFTYLLHALGRIQAVLISSVLATLFALPTLIFVAGLTGEAFTAVLSQIFIFSLCQGVIRYVSKSVYPTILVHVVRLVLMAL